MKFRPIQFLPIIICIALGATHLVFLGHFAINIPFIDEWDFFPSNPTFQWFFSFSNEHRPVILRLIIWFLYHLNGWNHITNQFINLFTYFFLLILIYLFVKKAIPKVPHWAILSFFPFLLSPINYETQSWGIAIVSHLWILFLFLSTYFLFNTKNKWTYLLYGSILNIFSIYTAAGGLVSTIGLFIVYSLYRINEAFKSNDKNHRRTCKYQVLIYCLIVGSAIAVWFIGYERPPHHPDRTFPISSKFWIYFLNVLSYGFGVDKVSSILGLLCLLIILIPILGQIWKSQFHLSNAHWSSYAVTLGLLLVLASIGIGRAGFHQEFGKIFRYSEFGLMLIPLSLINCWLFMGYYPKWRTRCILGLWIFFFITFFNNWQDFEYYKWMSLRRQAGINCVEKYYFGKGQDNCPMIYYAPLKSRLDEGKRLNMSFFRNLRAQKNLDLS